MRTLIRRDYERAFERVDVVAMPTSPTPAFRIGERVADPLQMYLADVFTVSANLAGLPAISVPCGFTAGGLPIGLQLTGRLVRRGDAASRSPTPTSGDTPNGRQPEIPSPAVLRSRLDVRCLRGPRCRTSSCSPCGCAISSCRIEGTGVEQRIAQVNAELDARGLARPHYWLSDEWFTPDGVPGVAIPFYLAHPRLARLELAQMLEVEGGDEETCLRILRHEAGHAIDNAYQLRRRPTRRRLFGTPDTPYPEYYTPKPYSKSFVQHLDHWYAQSHPDEDFAETFAVWLDPAVDVVDALRGMAGACASSNTWIGSCAGCRGTRADA